MWEAFGYLGMLVVLGYVIRLLAKAAGESGLEEFTLLRFRFKPNEKSRRSSLTSKGRYDDYQPSASGFLSVMEIPDFGKLLAKKTVKGHGSEPQMFVP